MRFKFGDKVSVISGDFYKGSRGTVIYYDVTSLQYEVQLNFNKVKSFYVDELKKLRRSRK